MNIEALRVFTTVAKLRSFSHAGEQLNFYPPIVRSQIRNLEGTFSE